MGIRVDASYVGLDKALDLPQAATLLRDAIACARSDSAADLLRKLR